MIDFIRQKITLLFLYQFSSENNKLVAVTRYFKLLFFSSYFYSKWNCARAWTLGKVFRVETFHFGSLFILNILKLWNALLILYGCSKFSKSKQAFNFSWENVYAIPNQIPILQYCAKLRKIMLRQLNIIAIWLHYFDDNDYVRLYMTVI